MYTNNILWTDDLGKVIYQLNMGLIHYNAPGIKVLNLEGSYLYGIIEHNGVRVGDFEYYNNESHVQYYSISRKFKQNDTLSLKIIEPNVYQTTLKVTSNALTTRVPTTDISKFTDFFQDYVRFDLTPSRPKLQSILKYLEFRPRTIRLPEEHTFHYTNCLAEINNRLVGEYVFPFIESRVFDNTNQFNNYRIYNTPNPGEIIINDSNKEIYGYSSTGWILIAGSYSEVLELNRIIHDTEYNEYYLIKNYNTLERFNPVIFNRKEPDN